MTRLRTYHLPGLSLADHRFRLPLDHDDPSRGEIEVYAREVVDPEKVDDTLPWLVFLQGGPGYGAPRPIERSGWIKRALQDYRVLLLDQRGTASSSSVTFQSLAGLATAREQADYLACFRADSIVRDCEAIRRELVGAGERWSVLGQSYGGFCITCYLSIAPEGLREAFVTGGLPSLDASAEEVYRNTYPLVAAKNRAFYERFPDDLERVCDIVSVLESTDVRLPCGDRLTPRRFQQLGIWLGMSDGAATLHYLLEEAFVDPPGGGGNRELSWAFLRGFENALHYDTHPIFSILHEPIYAQGAATRWAAERVRAEFPEFDPSRRDPLLFTGEMIFPWMFDEYRTLRPLKEAAEILADKDDWSSLYDAAVLEQNDVPCAAAVYYEDMYVFRPFSEQTAATIRGLRPWITNEYEHNALRADGERVLGRLIDLVRGQA